MALATFVDAIDVMRAATGPYRHVSESLLADYQRSVARIADGAALVSDTKLFEDIFAKVFDKEALQLNEQTKTLVLANLCLLYTSRCV